MKLTKREQYLLGILAILIFVYGYYNLVLKKQMSAIDGLKSKKSTLAVKVANMKNEANSYSAKEEEYKILNATILSKTEKLFPTIMQEKLIVNLDDILNKSKLDGYSIKFTEPKLQSLDAKKEESKKEENTLQSLTDQMNEENKQKESKDSASKSTNNSNKASSNITAEKMTANISFKGSYANVVSFINAVESFDKKIIVSNINLIQDGSMGVSGSLSLDFYAVPTIGEANKDYMKWDYSNKYGKDNPFLGAAIATPTDVNSNNKSEVSYDFLMSVKPISSDLPTVTLGKAKDSSKNTYVYGDNANIEPVEIYFTQKDGKYYYKYKTSRDSYPKQFSTEVEFKPNNSTILFKVSSTLRNSASDVSGANIKIFNNTDKMVNVVVSGDDKSKARVNVSGESGSVSVKNE